MPNLQLATDKAVYSLQMEVAPDTEFIRHRGRVFAVAETSANRRMWEEHTGDVPEGAKVQEYEEPTPEAVEADAKPSGVNAKERKAMPGNPRPNAKRTRQMAPQEPTEGNGKTTKQAKRK